MDSNEGDHKLPVVAVADMKRSEGSIFAIFLHQTIEAPGNRDEMNSCCVGESKNQGINNKIN